MAQLKESFHVVDARALPCAHHEQQEYLQLQEMEFPAGLNGPQFTRQKCGGANRGGVLFNPESTTLERIGAYRPTGQRPWQDLAHEESVLGPWSGHPLGLNVRRPTQPRSNLYDESGRIFRSSLSYSPPKRSAKLGPVKGSFGPPPGASCADPTLFLLRKDRALPRPVRFHYPEETTRPRPPAVADCPPLRHSTAPDFVVRNAADNIVLGTSIDAGRWSEDGWGPVRKGGGAHGIKGIGGRGSWKRTKASRGLAEGERDLNEEGLALVEEKIDNLRREDFSALLKGQSLSSAQRHENLKSLQLCHTLRAALSPPSKASRSAQSVATSPREGSSSLSRQPPPTAPAHARRVAGEGGAWGSKGGIGVWKDRRWRERHGDGEASERSDGGLQAMGAEERSALISALKDDWARWNKEYQQGTLNLAWLDHPSKVQRKEKAESVMNQLARQIEALEHQHVFVYDASHGKPTFTKQQSVKTRAGVSRLPSDETMMTSPRAARGEHSLTFVSPAKKTQPW